MSGSYKLEVEVYVIADSLQEAVDRVILISVTEDTDIGRIVCVDEPLENY
jgi:hypothetical protein